MTNAIMQLPDRGIQQVNGAIDHYNTLVLFMQHSLRDGLDYGKIQGCGDKPILFKPGAEKIATLFGLRESLERLEAIKDWTGNDFGEPFFNFEYKCTLKNREGHIVAECVGSCNSWEEKYRYRTAQRVCPQCGAAAIKRSQYEDRQTGDKGWYCHSKSGGCNAKFRSDDPQITSQQQGKVPNERIFDQVNTIDKMSQKRAFVGSVILAANASNFFAVEHSEIQTIDADWEPQEDIGNAAHLERVPGGGEAARDQGQLNRDRIQLIIGRTEHTLAQVKQMADGKTADQLNDEEMQSLIDQLLIDWGRKRHHVSVQIARNLLDEIRSEQPRITDNNLILRFAQRCSEALSEQVPTQRKAATTVGGVSID
ncbi:hypothetical protein [Halomicronema sp. CCY15110]|uniref:hypothetical protein n=1 Tax=Halomicronema sp. CCY15110 TaxID=2767773 RepID=UPI0019509A24|nr:hypothetical protein [Halomicronema sp. CCY15110]